MLPHYYTGTVNGKTVLLVKTIENAKFKLAYIASTGNSNTNMIKVPDKLQTILDKKFNFQDFTESNGVYMDGVPKNIADFTFMWLNPKTRKLAELLY